MRTCRIAPYLHHHLSADEVHAIADNIDIIHSVFSLDCSGIGGLHLGVVEFSPNLNIIQGRSGSGMTRMLDALKLNADHDIELPPLPRLDLPHSSSGMRLIRIIQALVEIQPADTSCLLLDDVLDFLDGDWAEKLIVFLAGHERQVIMTGEPCRIDILRKVLRLQFRLIGQTVTSPSLMQCWR